MTKKLLFPFLTLLALSAAGQAAPHVPYSNQPILSEATTKVSEHVWEMTGFPNVAIVVGTHATLVVDTGMGPENGATVARVVAKLAPNNSKLFLTTTHYHTEHVTGEPGFPPGTILIRNAVQQQELEKTGMCSLTYSAVCRRRTRSCLRVSSCGRRMSFSIAKP